MGRSTLPNQAVSPHKARTSRAGTSALSIPAVLEEMGARFSRGALHIDTLPFGIGDVTAGVENELQTVVMGTRESADLPQAIEHSVFFAAATQHAADHPLGPKGQELMRYLTHNPDGAWENSWVRLPYHTLNARARLCLHTDLLADKGLPHLGLRTDAGKYLVKKNADTTVRIPVSYLHKLALADVLGANADLPSALAHFGTELLSHFTNDNTAPEQLSSYIIPLKRERGMGRAVAKETAQRFLLTHLLTAYANRKFLLQQSGQYCLAYFAPHTPVRQKRLSRVIPAELYRELFMNPCLSGWPQGEKKSQYMHLCHDTLTRSRESARQRLRDNGISVRAGGLPAADTSLTNNGTHLSLGSITLSAYFGNAAAGPAQEKRLGDLAIKITEYFLPLFVGNYSAAPYRVDVAEFQAEHILGFLPHQLNDTHLRQQWRLWRKKARRTACGPAWWNKAMGRVLGLKGDYVQDMRLLDYFVALPGNLDYPLLDGQLGNGERAIHELDKQGIYNRNMTLYLPYRLREVARMGFSGFEGRHYSVFESLTQDLGHATELQLLITSLAYRYMATAGCTAAHIPDDRHTESERRQFFFASAAGIPACYVRRATTAPFLARILKHIPQARSSNRYPGYLKVPVGAYQRALVRMLRVDAADLIEMHGLTQMMQDLERRLDRPDEYSAAGKIQKDVLADLAVAGPMDVCGTEFNRATEDYYRTTLRVRHLGEALAFLQEDAVAMDNGHGAYAGELRSTLASILKGNEAGAYVRTVGAALVQDTLDLDDITRLIHIQLAAIRHDALVARAA